MAARRAEHGHAVADPRAYRRPAALRRLAVLDGEQGRKIIGRAPLDMRANVHFDAGTARARTAGSPYLAAGAALEAVAAAAGVPGTPELCGVGAGGTKTLGLTHADVISGVVVLPAAFCSAM